MRCRRTPLALLVIVFLGYSFFPWLSAAHEPHICPEEFPDAPALSGHISHADIVGGDLALNDILHAGEERFRAIFNICDGQGRPATTGAGDKRVADQPAFIRTSAPDSNSCAGCHNQPRVGGGGDFVANVFVLAQAEDPVTVHVLAERISISKRTGQAEVVGPSEGMIGSNERNTLGMFGAGAIEMLAREMTEDMHRTRERARQLARRHGREVTRHLETKGVSFGRITAFPDGSVDTREVQGVDADLVVKPFHQAGVVVSIREFTVNAFNHHHGMQAEERFDQNPNKGSDFDEDGVANELTLGDITATTIFQAALGVPGRLVSTDADIQARVERGERFFERIGCTSCHLPQMQLNSAMFTEPNPFNPAGTFSEMNQSFSFDMTEQGQGPFLESTPDGGAIVRAYTDLKRHNLCDDPSTADPIRFFCNERRAQGRADEDGRPGSEFFLTRKLWDVGSSAPYGHRGDLPTITEAILMHGGEARVSRDAFVNLSRRTMADIVMFLKTLQVLPVNSERVFEAPK